MQLKRWGRGTWGPGTPEGPTHPQWSRAARAAGLALVVAGLFTATALEAQEWEEFDYANLRLRGAGAELFLVSPTDHDATIGIGGRIDLGFLGPNVRVMPRVAYWSSSLDAAEVRRLEDRLVELVEEQNPGQSINLNLGTIDRSALIIGTDFHWMPAEVQAEIRPYLGVGAELYILGGSGVAIEDTFVEDGLDLVTAGASLVGGLEYELSDDFSLYGDLRATLVADVGSFTFTVGIAYITP